MSHYSLKFLNFQEEMNTPYLEPQVICWDNIRSIYSISSLLQIIYIITDIHSQFRDNIRSTYSIL